MVEVVFVFELFLLEVVKLGFRELVFFEVDEGWFGIGIVFVM